MYSYLLPFFIISLSDFHPIDLQKKKVGVGQRTNTKKVQQSVPWMAMDLFFFNFLSFSHFFSPLLLSLQVKNTGSSTFHVYFQHFNL